MTRTVVLIVAAVLVLATAQCAWSQAAWFLEADTSSGNLLAEDWSIPVTTDPLGAQQLTSPINTGAVAPSAGLGGIAVSQNSRGFWTTDGVPNGSNQFTLSYFGINHNHLCGSAVPTQTILVGSSTLSLRGLVVAPTSEIVCNVDGFIYALAYDVAQADPNRLLRIDLSATPPAIDRTWGLRRIGAATTTPFEDIAFDTAFTNSASPSDFVWAIDANGVVERFYPITSATTLTAGEFHTIGVPPGKGTATFAGIAIDGSRPSTLPLFTRPMNFPAFVSGTICGLNADGNVWTLDATSAGGLTQEMWSVGVAADYRGFDYSAELIRLGIPCGGCSGATTNASRADIAWPSSIGNPQPTLNYPKPNGALCNRDTVEIQACNMPFTSITPYLVRSRGYNPVNVSGTGGQFPCLFYPDTVLSQNNVAYVPATGGLTISAPATVYAWVMSIGSTPPRPQIALDTRIVEYVQWAFMCGPNQPFNLNSAPAISDAFRMAWSSR